MLSIISIIWTTIILIASLSKLYVFRLFLKKKTPYIVGVPLLKMLPNCMRPWLKERQSFCKIL